MLVAKADLRMKPTHFLTLIASLLNLPLRCKADKCLPSGEDKSATSDWSKVVPDSQKSFSNKRAKFSRRIRINFRISDSHHSTVTCADFVHFRFQHDFRICLLTSCLIKNYIFCTYIFFKMSIALWGYIVKQTSNVPEAGKYDNI